MIHFIQWMKNPMVFTPLIVWSLMWKGLALWRAARLRQVGWYIALLVINTVGIFEIIYLVATNNKAASRTKPLK